MTGRGRIIRRVSLLIAAAAALLTQPCLAERQHRIEMAPEVEQLKVTSSGVAAVCRQKLGENLSRLFECPQLQTVGRDGLVKNFMYSVVFIAKLRNSQYRTGKYWVSDSDLLPSGRPFKLPIG